MSELSHTRADSTCKDGLHAWVTLPSGTVCRDCGAVGPAVPMPPKRIVKKFLVTYEGDETTRWHEADERVASALLVLAKTTGHSFTRGAVPQVTVEALP